MSPVLETDKNLGVFTRRTTHSPVANWLIPAVLSLVLECSRFVNMDDPVDEKFNDTCSTLASLLIKRGIVDTWSFDAHADWILSPDASYHALGYVFEIGGVVVEDGT